MNTFSAGECIRFGWETFKKRPWFFILVTAALGGASRVSSDVTNLISGDGSVAILIAAVAVLGLVAGLLIDLGRTNLLLKAHDNVAAAQLNDLWIPRLFWKYVGTYILVSIVFFVGLILLIVPGIIWGLRYMFALNLIVDRNLKPFEAMKESARITYGNKWQLLGLVLLLVLVNILGFLALIVGLLVSMPVTALAFVHAYRTLSRMAPAV